MLNKISLTSILILFTILLYGQAAINSRLDKAYAFYDAKQYDSSYKYFNSLKKEMLKSDTLFRDVAFGASASVYFKELAAKNSNDWINTILLANEFLNDVSEYKGIIAQGIAGKKYFAFKDLVVAYFGLNRKDSAAIYQAKLYEGYKTKSLPDGIDKYYNFEKFNWQGLNVWGYEWYPNLGDKETEGSFSKQVYYIYSANPDGSDKDQLFRLHTIKIHKLAPDDPKADYVLTFRKTNKDGEASKTLWDYLFLNPVDYTELHNAIIDFLEKNKSQVLSMKK